MLCFSPVRLRIQEQQNAGNPIQGITHSPRAGHTDWIVDCIGELLRLNDLE